MDSVPSLDSEANSRHQKGERRHQLERSILGVPCNLHLPGRSAAEDAVPDRSPTEVELILTRHPCLSFSAVVGWWEEVAAVRKDSIRTRPICPACAALISSVRVGFLAAHLDLPRLLEKEGEDGNHAPGARCLRLPRSMP
ncbi:hypothetical protein E2562_022730 [Oryza meyeriana var. granulata]|uniref:Uncharacterized protein n=1 Tax=Oryza meyeriana var. granulata TaxID=110450 RepID=A0A6G1FB49_9ORYZ|nr:hypothetical protein E2562_022730 [Oryza meyeriana var. granulata]